MHERTAGQWFESDPLWFKHAVFYEIHTRAFFDGNDDGSGDLRGVTDKLDYLQWLGVDCLWLLPLYPSPLRDGGYDIADFTNVHQDYGTVEDFRQLIEAAHQRGIRVIADLVMNHTSSDHPWFQASRADRDGPYGDWYVWSDTDEPWQEARIIFLDTEPSNWTWDPVRGQYFWHRFFSHQPDLNYDNPEVQQAMLDVLRFWLDLGIDGFRMDAIPYLYERDGTNGENLPESHDYLKRVREEIDANYADKVLLAEANQWPEDVVEYFGDGDECHMCFHFPVMPRMFMSLRREDATPIYEILERTPPIPENCQWGLFLRNHDELTLEMVTDDERDYMYNEYAKDPRMKLNLGIRRRLAPLLDGGRDEIQLLHAIMFSLPGSPVLYYGDEIGMGDNIFLGDRDGVRTPMQWTGDRNGGFSRSDFAQLYLPPLMDPVYGYQAVNVEAQLRTPTSLLRWIRRFIALRKQHPVFGLGTYEPLETSNPRIFAHVRRYEDDIVLCVHNVARSAQAVELDLARFRGMVPEEMFGRTAFPPVGELPYLLTLGTARLLLVPAARAGGGRVNTPHRLAMSIPEDALREFVLSQRWFGAKSREIAHFQVVAAPVVRTEEPLLALAVVEIRFHPGTHELYQVPLGFRREWQDGIAEVEGWVAYDALADPELARELVECMRRQDDVAGGEAMVEFRATGEAAGSLEQVRPMGREQSNTSLVFDDDLVLKVYRRIEAGVNPELELLRFLTDRGFPSIASLEGWAAYLGTPLEATLAIAQDYVAGEGDGWELALEALRSGKGDEFVDKLRLLGETTGAMHSVLASDQSDPSFSPEEPSAEALGLLTASVDEEIEGLFSRCPTCPSSRRSPAAARRCASSSAGSRTPGTSGR